MIIKSEQDAQIAFKRLVEKQINDITKDYANNIRVGKICDVNQGSRQLSVEIYGTGEIINGIKYQKGVSFGVYINDTALIVSPDPKNRSQNFAVGIY